MGEASNNDWSLFFLRFDVGMIGLMGDMGASSSTMSITEAFGSVDSVDSAGDATDRAGENVTADSTAFGACVSDT